MSLGSEKRPLRVAIIGAGPSGFYAADALFKSGKAVTVDAYDRLPTPFGLLRAGVAPDHQQMKSVGKYYQRVVDKNHENFRFLGNVEVGKDITVEELQLYYDAIVFSYGSESDKKTGLTGEDLKNSYSAREFVGWYNGHPDYQDYTFDLTQKSVAIIGQGNVAVDVARILAKTQNELKTSDITQQSLNALKDCKVTDIYMIGRRGPVQAAFTELEIKELGKLEDCDIIVKPEDLTLDDANKEELAASNKARKNYAILETLSQKPQEGKSKRIHIVFFQSPKAFNGTTQVEGLTLDTINLEGEAFKQKARPTGEETIIESGLIFRSIGYKGEGIQGIPFDDKKGVIPNEKGRVTNDGTPVNGLYTSGWIKRGPSGVLGTNKPCSTETIACMLEDIATLTLCKTPDTDAVLSLLKDRNVEVISFEDWQKINAIEIAEGEKVGKPREKLTSVVDILSAVKTTVS